MYKKLALACLIALLSMSALAKTGYYRWLDDNTQVHFTQNPPTDRPSKFVETKRGYNNDDVNPKSPQPLPPKRADSAASKQEPQQVEILPDKNPERCTQARDALQSFSRGQRVRVTDDKGEARILNTQELNSQKEKAQELIKIYC
ncbi:MAG: hypothetical protein ACI89D_002432 [Bermanella sp.]|jgi:hypothetical protein